MISSVVMWQKDGYFQSDPSQFTSLRFRGQRELCLGSMHLFHQVCWFHNLMDLRPLDFQTIRGWGPNLKDSLGTPHLKGSTLQGLRKQESKLFLSPLTFKLVLISLDSGGVYSYGDPLEIIILNEIGKRQEYHGGTVDEQGVLFPDKRGGQWGWSSCRSWCTFLSLIISISFEPTADPKKKGKNARPLILISERILGWHKTCLVLPSNCREHNLVKCQTSRLGLLRKG